MQSTTPAPRQSSPVFARGALAAYVLLIVYASWYPFAGWHLSGLSPLSFLNLSMPQYWTTFDVLVNVVGYIPFGMLIVFALYPHVRGVLAMILAVACGIAISGTMEAVQTYLPNRVPSNLDLLTNTLGCLLGAVVGVRGAPSFLDRSHLNYLRQKWFTPQASHGIVLLGLWPLAQIYPQGYLFGHGQLMPIISDWLSNLTDTNIDLVGMLRPEVALTVEQYWLSETIITACGLTGAVLTMMCLLRRAAPRIGLAVMLIAGALLVKALASALLFTPDNAFVWLTPGAQGGFIIGLIMLAGLTFAPQVAQRRLAMLTLALTLVVVNGIPVNPYFSATLQSWVQGKFLNFNGAAQFLSLLWPLFALWFLALPLHKQTR
jgi:VanZ family protein